MRVLRIALKLVLPRNIYIYIYNQFEIQNLSTFKVKLKRIFYNENEIENVGNKMW